ncbi:MAG TPA: HNH endonuclease [Desulfuromonadales bacterium]|nr:HNH endonuclease [Desulfuromonadales bacterium]
MGFFERLFDNTTKDIAFAEQNGKCSRCGRDLGYEQRGNSGDNCQDWEAHHKKAHSKGGTTSLRNCELLCSDCHKNTGSYGR